MNAMVAAVGRYGMALPAAAKMYGVVGYCWGGTASFNHAVFNAPGMKAAVVYYGSAPAGTEIAKVKVPVLGLYGENDQRVNATIPMADSTMRAIKGDVRVEGLSGRGAWVPARAGSAGESRGVARGVARDDRVVQEVSEVDARMDREAITRYLRESLRGDRAGGRVGRDVVLLQPREATPAWGLLRDDQGARRGARPRIRRSGAQMCFA